MNKKVAALLLPLALAGCWESERSCNSRLYQSAKDDVNLTTRQELHIMVQLDALEKNPDLNVCDYTVLGDQVIKID